MPARVRNLGYVVIEAIDVEGWREFGSHLCGMQVEDVSDDVIRFRIDSKEWRIEVRRGDRDAVVVLGWEVAGPQDLDAIVGRLHADGVATLGGDPDRVTARGVVDVVEFDDPDSLVTLELYYGLRESLESFVSPTGVRFVTGEGGLGHVFQIVNDKADYWHLYADVLGMCLSDVIHSPKRGADLTFLHGGPRHHSMAYAHLEGMEPGFGHLMIEVEKVDDVGRAYDKVLDGEAQLITTLGRHTNDEMLSFYVRTPSGLGLEYGCGGLEIDESTWLPSRYEDAHYWGHRRATPIDPKDPADVE